MHGIILPGPPFELSQVFVVHETKDWPELITEC